MEMENAEGIRSVVLRRTENVGLGFSIMGGAGYEFPPVIYGIERDSPAARSGQLEAGDIILAINEREVVKLSTKEVLKCLRLSGDIVHIKYKRDPHVVSRVRQFLSTPHYLEGQENLQHQQYHSFQSSPHKQSGVRSSKTSQIPVYQHYHTSPLNSPTARASTIPISCPKSPVGNVNAGEEKQLNDITFSDDLFINHSHHHGSVNNSSNMQHSHHRQQNSLQAGQLVYDVSSCQNIVGKNGRKNCETFVMTGDAILNLTRNDSNESYRLSPTKTTSKLTPLPQMPVFVEREKDFHRRLQMERNMSREQEKELEKDRSKSDPISPPLPPPPNPDEIGSKDSQNSISNKSDNLPPPPPPENDSNSLEQRLIQIGNVGTRLDEDRCNLLINNHDGDLHNGNNVDNVCNNSSNRNHNNEDTSISSSVMSDSGDEELGDAEVDEDVKKMIATDSYVHTDINRIVLKVEAKKLEAGQDKMEIDDNAPEKVLPEKERYCEYILLNGSPGAMTEEDRSVREDYSDRQGSNSSRQEINYQIAKGAEKHTSKSSNRDRSTGEDDNFQGTGSEGENEIDESNSEFGVVGAEGELLSSNGVGSGSGGSFSGGESDSSDVESMRVAPVVKAVDLPSAERLAKRLFTLDGFKVSDVWRQLSKSNDFSRAVATEYLKFFDFADQPLDVSLRKFLSVCPLRGETQERERVLSYFSTRYVESCPNVFASQDSVHTLTCALMLLNTDIYSGSRSGRRMTSSEFIENLSGLNDGTDFPKTILKQLYHSIKSQPLVSPLETDDEESNRDILPMDPPVSSPSMEFKRGYLMRKSTFEMGGKKTPLGKRSWRMYFCRLKELLLVLSHDETNKSSVQHLVPLKLHHAFAAIAADYRKRQHVFRLIMADRSQFLFQSSDTREMNSWIEMINWNAARYSSPALEAPCSSSGRYEKPLLPSSISKMSPRDQIVTHQAALARWEEELEELNQPRSNKGSSANAKRDFKEKITFFQFEIRRYRSYIEVLDKRATETNSMEGPNDELVELQVLPNPPAILMEMDESS